MDDIHGEPYTPPGSHLDVQVDFLDVHLDMSVYELYQVDPSPGCQLDPQVDTGGHGETYYSPSNWTSGGHPGHT